MQSSDRLRGALEKAALMVVGIDSAEEAVRDLRNMLGHGKLYYGYPQHPERLGWAG